MRGGTMADREKVIKGLISIHPSHAGRDSRRWRRTFRRSHFNPPAPCGAGLSFVWLLFAQWQISIHPPHAGRDSISTTSLSALRIFQSTRPMRGGTAISKPSFWNSVAFQSTRPMRGGTSSGRILSPVVYFNPPAPCGAGHFMLSSCYIIRYFNPPAPCGAGPLAPEALVR